MSRMTHSKCGECRNYFKCDSACKNDWACEDFEPQGKTLFDRITSSPEVLAPKFVYYTVSRHQFGTCYWYCSALIPGEKWSKEVEAIAATVARLKEVAE